MINISNSNLDTDVLARLNNSQLTDLPQAVAELYTLAGLQAPAITLFPSPFAASDFFSTLRENVSPIDSSHLDRMLTIPVSRSGAYDPVLV